MFAGLGVLLLVAGAIVRWAIDGDVENTNLDMLGLILMGGGLLSLLIALIQGMGWMSATRRHVQTERLVSPDGTHVVEETRSH